MRVPSCEANEEPACRDMPKRKLAYTEAAHGKRIEDATDARREAVDQMMAMLSFNKFWDVVSGNVELVEQFIKVMREIKGEMADRRCLEEKNDEASISALHRLPGLREVESQC